MSANVWYKYQRFDDTFSEQLLLHRKLWVSSPLDFNDPFDCQITFSYHANRPQIEKFYQDEIEIGLPNLSPAEKSKALQDIISVYDTHSIDDIKQFRKQFNDERLQRIGIISLTSKNDHILMWSHYANGHKGYCLEFNNHGVLKTAKEVKYKDTQPKLDFYLSTRDEKAEAQFLTKWTHWKYESEHRVLLEKGRVEYDFNEDYLNGIILGCKMRECHKICIQTWLKSWKKKVKLYQAKPVEGEYKVEIEPLN